MKPALFCIAMLIGCLNGGSAEFCGGQEPSSAPTASAEQQSSPVSSLPLPSSLAKAGTPKTGPETKPKAPTVKVAHDGRKFIGQPLAWDGKQLGMLRLDGELRLIPLVDKANLELVSPKFEPYTPSELKTRLKREFGDRYDISTTKNCVVVHPWGKAEYWAEPFEVMIRRFEAYCLKQKVELKEPQFTSIVIVLRSRKDFDRYMHNEIKLHNGNVAGFYSRVSNRMVTYDPSGLVRKPAEKSWLLGSHTMFHESAHQLAFNRGLHNRFSPPPLWLSEGLAMLFETTGVNKKRLKTLRKLYDKRKVSGKLNQLITNDILFQLEPELAYSLSWGLTHYLSKKNPEAYFAFLKEDANRPNFQVSPPPLRLKEFAKHFGNDIDQLEDDMRFFYQ